MSSRSLYLAAYDISDSRRRRHIRRTLRSFASGGQKSAFECWLSPADMRALLKDIRGSIDIHCDRFGLLPLDPRRRIITLGKATAPSDPGFLYFG